MPKASLCAQARTAAAPSGRRCAAVQSLLAALALLQGVLCGPVGDAKASPPHSVSVADDTGAMLEQQVGSRIDVAGMRFPSRLSEADAASFEFETHDAKGLLFHADSDDGRHEITAWIDNGAVKVRLTGWCLWLKLGEVLWDDINVSDGGMHKFTVHSKRSGGIRFRVDDRDELAFFHTSRAVFSCWHVDNFYFGGPGPKRFYAENNSDSEYSYKMTSCIKNFSVNSTSSQPKFSYYRVSSCPRKGFAADTALLQRRHQQRAPHSPALASQQHRHPRSSNATTTPRPASAIASVESGL